MYPFENLNYLPVVSTRIWPLETELVLNKANELEIRDSSEVKTKIYSFFSRHVHGHKNNSNLTFLLISLFLQPNLNILNIRFDAPLLVQGGKSGFSVWLRQKVDTGWRRDRTDRKPRPILFFGR